MLGGGGKVGILMKGKCEQVALKQIQQIKDDV